MPTKRLIALFCFNQLFHWSMIGLILPIMTLFMLEKGFNLFQIGVALGVHSAMVLLLELPTGGLADSIGRKRVYLISLLVMCTAMMTFLLSRSYEMLLVGTALMGTARALSSGTLDAWFVDEFNKLTPKGNLQAALAKVGIFISLGLALGSLLGGLLPMIIGPTVAQWYHFDIYSGNLAVIAILTLIQLGLTTFLIHDPLTTQSKGDVWSGLKQFPIIMNTSLQFGLKQKAVLLLLISSVGWGMGVSGIEFLWQPQLKAIIGSESQTWIFGVVGAGYFFACALGNLLVTPICKLFRNHYAFISTGSRFLMGTFLAILAFQNNLFGFIGIYWLLFTFNGIMDSPHATLFNENIPEEKRSTLLSFDSFMMQSGGLIGSITLGYIAEQFSIPMAWYGGAIILSLSALCYLFIPRKKAIPHTDTLGTKPV